MGSNNVDISAEITKIVSILYGIEDERKNLDTMVKSMETVKEDGGSVTLDIFPDGGEGGSNTELSWEESKRCIAALVAGYNDHISAAKRDIVVILNSLVYRKTDVGFAYE